MSSYHLILIALKVQTFQFFVPPNVNGQALYAYWSWVGEYIHTQAYLNVRLQSIANLHEKIFLGIPYEFQLRLWFDHLVE